MEKADFFSLAIDYYEGRARVHVAAVHQELCEEEHPGEACARGAREAPRPQVLHVPEGLHDGGQPEDACERGAREAPRPQVLARKLKVERS